MLILLSLISAAQAERPEGIAPSAATARPSTAAPATLPGEPEPEPQNGVANAIGLVMTDTAPTGCGEAFDGDRVGNRRAAQATAGQLACRTEDHRNAETIVALNVTAAAAGIVVLPGGKGMVAPGGAPGEAFFTKTDANGTMTVALGDTTAPINAAGQHGWSYGVQRPDGTLTTYDPGDVADPARWYMDSVQGIPVVTVVEADAPSTGGSSGSVEGKKETAAERLDRGYRNSRR